MLVKGSDPSSIKTFIISTNHLLFLGVQAILSHVTTIAMVNWNGNSHDAIQKEQPRLIIVDMGSHECVTELIGKIKKTVPLARILLLGGLNDMERTRKALDFGVDGVVLTVQPSKVLLAAVAALTHLSPNVGSVNTNGCSAPRPHIAVWPASLTQRERDIVQLVGQGLSNQEIADRQAYRSSPCAITSPVFLTSWG